MVHFQADLRGRLRHTSAEAAWVTGSTATRIVGGDFKVAPPVNNGWPNSWEADQSLARTALLATMSDTTLENKIDYVFPRQRVSPRASA